MSVLLEVSRDGGEGQVSPTWLPTSEAHTAPNPYLSALCKQMLSQDDVKLVSAGRKSLNEKD